MPLASNRFGIRTFERGVEAETLACRTGATAAALVIHQAKGIEGPIELVALGGTLMVNFENMGNHYEAITLTGPVKFIFEGSINNASFD